MESIREKVLRLAGVKQQLNPGWRWGQTVFNTCYELYPSLADKIRSTKYDPFYDDGKVESFLEQLN